MSYVYNPKTGKSFATKNLEWLLRHWKDVERFDAAEVDRSPHGSGFLVAHLRGGGHYVTDFASYSVMHDWLSRPVFRGLPIFRAFVRFTAESEDLDVAGSFASGDDAADKEMVDNIHSRLESGDQWAWFYAKVECERGDFKVSDGLGACSYRSERDFRAVLPNAYYPDMVRGVLESVRSQVIAACGAADEDIK